MITSKDVRNKRFEKAAFGYKQEEIDEFLSQLEAELDEMERERAEANSKIQVLADKGREYMRDEDALKDALLGAQKQGHQVLNDANEKAEQILAEAKEKAAKILREAEDKAQTLVSDANNMTAREKEKYLQLQSDAVDLRNELITLYSKHIKNIDELPTAADVEASRVALEEKYPTKPVDAPVEPGGRAQLAGRRVEQLHAGVRRNERHRGAGRLFRRH